VARPTLAIPGACDEAGGLEHLDVPRHGLLADGKRLGELIHGRLAPREARDQAAPHRVGEGQECPVESGLAFVQTNQPICLSTT